MCGRYTLIRHDRLVEIIPNFTMPVNLRLVARYNIAPTQEIPVLFPSGELGLCRWGLVPHWSKDQKTAFAMINARAETLAEKPAYRKLVERNRCLIPADGFFEWEKRGKKKTPMYIRIKGAPLFGFAGLWDLWRGGDGQEVRSCTIVTTEANSLVAPIHDRMPAIVPVEDFAKWLTGDVAGALELLRPFDAERMEAFAVNPVVNRAVRDVPECVKPEEGEKGLFG